MSALLTIFAFSGVALDHLVAGFEARKSHVSDRVLLVVGLFRRDNGSEGRKREVNTGETVQYSASDNNIFAILKILTEPGWSGIRSNRRLRNHRNEGMQ